ncbi:sulfite exporter TauE/SafE family protein [Aurantimonas sp. NFXS3]|uniref:sulfite exporter TauE/SafE family protein n=1 Tax=Aurantimonas sp. NFXS3 TaxID=2818434 RepID=UPI003B8D5AAE
MAGDFNSERWATSIRNGGRHHLGSVGDISRNSHALLLIVTPGDAFLWILPWLLLLATAIFATGPMLLNVLQQRGAGAAGPVLSDTAIFAVSVYGGYFNGGLGIMLLATFGLLGHVDLHGMNGLKNVLSALLSLISAGAFVWAGLIFWEQTAVMALSAMAGGYAGARLSRRIVRTDLLRGFGRPPPGGPRQILVHERPLRQGWRGRRSWSGWRRRPLQNLRCRRAVA